jgi:hypothetical protein
MLPLCGGCNTRLIGQSHKNIKLSNNLIQNLKRISEYTKIHNYKVSRIKYRYKHNFFQNGKHYKIKNLINWIGPKLKIF